MYGMMHHMPKALLLLDLQRINGDLLMQVVLWRLPIATADRPHGIKYRLYCGRAGQCIVRYDNESGKGDHRHFGDCEEPYTFVTPEQLLQDFLADVLRLTGWRVE